MSHISQHGAAATLNMSCSHPQLQALPQPFLRSAARLIFLKMQIVSCLQSSSGSASLLRIKPRFLPVACKALEGVASL